MNPIIKVEELSKTFKRLKKTDGFKGSVNSLFSRKYEEVEAVNSISFNIEEGEVVGFIGSNGAGKTSTLKILSGIMHPSSGMVSVLGYKPWERKFDFLKSISLVMGQKFQLWWDLPASDSFKLIKEIYQIADKDFSSNLNELVELLEVSDLMNTPLRNLSLGQRMKFELIAALLHNPKVVFLDEPTIGLDVIMQKRIRKFLREYNSRSNATILLTSHHMDDIKEVCSRIVIIHQGSIIFDGSIENLMSKYVTTKQIKFHLNKAAKREDFKGLGKLTEFNGVAGRLEVKRSEAVHCSTKLINQFDIDDLDIAEANLDSIVREIIS